MLELASRVATRAERIDRAVSSMHARLGRMLPGGEVQEVGQAIWVVSASPLPFVNGVIRYDARSFHGPTSERELDNCLAVLSTYDVPWRFRAWAHLGADVLVPRLVARGMIEGRTDQAMWLDLPSAAPAGTGQTAKASQPSKATLARIDVRPATDASEYPAWAKSFTRATEISSQHAELVDKILAAPRWASLVARVNRRPVGCLTLAFEDDLAIVHNVGVLPSARRLGVSRRLLLAAHEAAAARGVRACVVLAAPEGSDACARLGYHAVTSVTYLMPPELPSGVIRRAL